MGCSERAQGGGEAAGGERGRRGVQGHKTWPDAAIVGCREWARGGGEAASGEGGRHGAQVSLWLETPVPGCRKRAQGGGEAASGEGRRRGVQGHKQWLDSAGVGCMPRA